MNLLIVDDEYFSRENIKELLPWSQYGIDHIKEADDGINAQAVCENYEPDIILTDVKMPRMDGIELAFNIRNKFPNCAIIFMSGYSDKEYLKSAIKLKAISYVEKPVLKEELSDAVKAAVDLCKQKQQETKLSMHTDAISSWMRSQLALQLICKNTDLAKIQNKFHDVGIDLPLEGCFVTILVKLYDTDSLELEQYHELTDSIFTIIHNASIETSVNVMFAQEESCFIIHIYESISGENMLIQKKINNFCTVFRDKLLDKKLLFAVGIGRSESQIARLSNSYKTAVSALHQTFFREPGYICYYKENILEQFKFSENSISEYTSNLNEGSKQYTICFIKSLTTDIRRYENTKEIEIKKFYFNLLSILMQISRKKLVDVFPEFVGEHEIWEYILTFHFLYQLEEFLITRTTRYFDLLEEKIDNNGPVDMIIQYIHRNYKNEILSLTMISEEMNLAPTYISYIFKKRTGKTLNQYITEYRVKKAKELLQQKRIKISDITMLVGYRDGNYFAKLFKKYTGMSPSEYRGNS